MNIADLRAHLESIETERREIHEAAGTEPLTDEQQSRWDELDADDTETREQLAAAEETEARAQRVAESRARWGSQQVTPARPETTDVRSLSGPEARDAALRTLEDRGATAHLSTGAVDGLERLVRQQTRSTDGSQIARRLLLTESDAYRSAFQKLVTSPNAVLSPEEGRAVEQFNEFRAMSIGTDGAGGFGVPVLIDPTIVLDAQGHPNDFFRISRVETITTDTWKGVSSAGVSWSFDAEATEVSDDSPTIAQPSVPTHKAQGYIPYSIEVGQDYPGFASEMATLLSEGYSELLVDKFTTGTGTNQPTGIVTALDGSTSERDTATTDVLAAADVNATWAALPIRYRGNASWMSHTTVNNSVQQLGNGADAAFTVDFTAEGVGRLKGREYLLNDYMNSTFASNVAPFLIVGDFRNYLIAQRAGMSIELVPHVFSTTTNRPSGERAWYAWARVGADSINDKGFRALSDNGA